MVCSKIGMTLERNREVEAVPSSIESAAAGLRRSSARLFLLADEGQDEGAAVRRGAVLEQEDALPGAELQPTVGDGMVSWVWVSALLMWAGMSSGPSSLWR